MLTEQELSQISSRAAQASPPPWHIHSIMVVNNHLSIAGNWESQYDEPNMEFIAHSRTDIDNLLSDLKSSKIYINKLEEEINDLLIQIENLKKLLAPKV